MIKKYPDNFVIGSDAVGKSSAIPFELKKFNVLLQALPKNVREKVAHLNLKSILERSSKARTAKGFGSKGITLPNAFSLDDSFGLESLRGK